jgi:BMFP domain-containing protein YqiC
MGPEFINNYIERLINEISELVKTKLLLQTQLDIQQQMTAEIQNKNQKLEEKIQKLETTLSGEKIKKIKKPKDDSIF